MILDTEVFETHSVRVTIENEPDVKADHVQYMIRPNELIAAWSRNNGSRWGLSRITVRGPRVLGSDQTSHVVTGSRVWLGNPTGRHTFDPPSWVLSIVNEVKPNGWELVTS